MEETKRARRASVKLPMTENELRDRRLTVNVFPELGKGGKGVVFTERQDTDRGKAYRFLLAGCPTGLGVRVGITDTSYELSRRGPDGFRRVALDSVHDLSFKQAYNLALAHGQVIEETCENPKVRKARKAKNEDVKRITVEGCFELYIVDLERRLLLGKVKASSILAVKDSLERLKRPEIGLARWEVRAITKEVAVQAFHGTRLSSMRLSNPYAHSGSVGRRKGLGDAIDDGAPRARRGRQVCPAGAGGGQSGSRAKRQPSTPWAMPSAP